MCAWQYLPKYGSVVNGRDAIILCELDPKDIVAIPSDYNNSKLRVCKYVPIEEYTYDQGEINNILFRGASFISGEEVEEDEDEDCYYDQEWSNGY